MRSKETFCKQHIFVISHYREIAAYAGIIPEGLQVRAHRLKSTCHGEEPHLVKVFQLPIKSIVLIDLIKNKRLYNAVSQVTYFSRPEELG